jgi:hypothetical protein
MILLAIAGGGGSSSGGGGGSSGGSSFSSSSYGDSSSYDTTDASSVMVIFVIIASFIITVAVAMIALGRKGVSVKSDADLTKDELAAKHLFLRYQADWSKNDSAAMRAYMTDKYHHRAELMVKAMQLQSRRNVVDTPQSGRITSTTDANGRVAVTFYDASATDKLIDEKTGKEINSRHVVFTETWAFMKKPDGKLLLDDTTPDTVSQAMSIDSMREFAFKHKLEYFSDWGTLTLPVRGLIFDEGNFTDSDINNYMVGEYGGQLIQMYSYTPNVNILVNGRPYPIYIVGQIAVPDKNYGGIIVMKNKLIDRKPKGYKKYELEWGDFNKKYDVFATDADKVTSFELLNPTFMEYLHDKVGLDFTLEVVDNIIYFYVKPKTGIKNYETLLEVLLRAYKELKM